MHNIKHLSSSALFAITQRAEEFVLYVGRRPYDWRSVDLWLSDVAEDVEQVDWRWLEPPELGTLAPETKKVAEVIRVTTLRIRFQAELSRS